MADDQASTEMLLRDVERQLDVVDSNLLSFEPDFLPAACGELCRAVMDYARVLKSMLSIQMLDRAMVRRVEAVTRRLRLQRDSLARRGVVVDRALACIMPLQADVTYSIPGERMTFGVNGPH